MMNAIPKLAALIQPEAVRLIEDAKSKNQLKDKELLSILVLDEPSGHAALWFREWPSECRPSSTKTSSSASFKTVSGSIPVASLAILKTSLRLLPISLPNLNAHLASPRPASLKSGFCLEPLLQAD
jgi:hypothetical protein